MTVYIYFFIGVIWSWWLEYYTTKHLEGELGADWEWKERFLHTGLWPVTFALFIYSIFKQK